MIEIRNLLVFPSGEIAVSWSDDHESYFEPRRLRLACSCAHCVDEMTGVKTLRDEQVPADVRLTDWQPVGRYGISTAWSDGHTTGIYTFERLRELCDCEDCRR